MQTGEWSHKIEKVKKLASVAGDLSISLPQLALAWCLKNPKVSTVLTGASKPEQVTENMRELIGAGLYRLR